MLKSVVELAEIRNKLNAFCIINTVIVSVMITSLLSIIRAQVVERKKIYLLYTQS